MSNKMSTSTPNPIRPQGGIASGNTIILTSFIGSNLYVLTAGTSVNSVMLQQVLNTTTYPFTLLVPQSSMLQFTVGSTGNGITLLFSTGTYLSYDNTGTLQLGSQLPMFFNQSTYSDFLYFANLLLSGVTYYVVGISPDNDYTTFSSRTINSKCHSYTFTNTCRTNTYTSV